MPLTLFTLDATLAWLRGFAVVIADNEELLTALDAAIGDADHGANMRRGMTAVVETLDASPPPTIAGALRGSGMALVNTVGGASGPLYGTFLLRMADTAGERASLTGPELVAALRAGLDGLQARGRAVLGEKTMVDVLEPAIEAMDAAVATGDPIGEAASRAAITAQAARDATAPLVARKGRASYLGERSAGNVDPGSASAALLLAALAAALVTGAPAEPLSRGVGA